MAEVSYTTQQMLEEKYSKTQLIDVLKDEFTFLAHSHENEDEIPFIWDCLVHICIHRQADPTTMVGILSPKHGNPQEVADKLTNVVINTEFINYDMNLDRFVIAFDISDDVKERLELYQYPLPMVVKPMGVTKNNSYGYMTIPGSVVLNSENTRAFISNDVNLQHINRVNGIELSLNMKVVEADHANYKKPKRKQGEDFAEYKKRVKQAEIFHNRSYEIMREISDISPKFHMVHRYDRRGRCYTSGYHINPQGTDANKAVLELHQKQLISAHPEEDDV